MDKKVPLETSWVLKIYTCQWNEIVLQIDTQIDHSPYLRLYVCMFVYVYVCMCVCVSACVWTFKFDSDSMKWCDFGRVFVRGKDSTEWVKMMFPSWLRRDICQFRISDIDEFVFEIVFNRKGRNNCHQIFRNLLLNSTLHCKIHW